MAGKKVHFSNHEFEVATIYYWLIILIALALALLVTAIMSFYTITPGESGVVVRLGKVTRIVEPGVHWKLPWGIDHLYRVKVNYQYSVEFGFRETQADSGAAPVDEFYLPEARLLTGDLKMIDLQWVVQYRIQDPVAYLFSVENPESTIRMVGLAAMRTAVGDYSFHEAFQTERRAIAEQAKQLMQSKFDLYKLGVVVQHVQLKEARPAVNIEPVGMTTPTITPPAGTLEDSTKTDSTRKVW
jgi:membrane protease subunit HflK